jgi:N-acylglucosamine-6-phosphate 2-epimerase
MGPIQLSESLEALRHRLIVSVQSERREPLAPVPVLEALCHSVVQGGAAGLRLADLDLIRSLRTNGMTLPIIGLSKPDPLPAFPAEEVYITPTVLEGVALWEAGATIIATDATLRHRPDGYSLAQWVEGMRKQAPGWALI